MKSLSNVLIVIFLLLSCSSDDSLDLNNLKTLCVVEDATVDLAWLEEEIRERESNTDDFSKYRYISQSVYNGQVIIIYLNCCPTCNSIFTVYNCKGEFIGVIGNRDEDIPADVLENDEIIWKANNFACTF